MDFAAVLEKLRAFFEEEQIPHALAGGLALACLGLARTTLDVDLAVPESEQEAIVTYLEERYLELAASL